MLSHSLFYLNRIESIAYSSFCLFLSPGLIVVHMFHVLLVVALLMLSTRCKKMEVFLSPDPVFPSKEKATVRILFFPEIER